MKTNYVLTILLLVVIISGCHPGKEMKEYGYIFHESTGHTEYIKYDSKEMPIRFSKNSKKEALYSLQNLMPSILYPNSNGEKIYIVGYLDIRKSEFVLENWYIIIPFKESRIVDETELPHKVEIIERSMLKIQDFSISPHFNPNNPDFKPKNYTKRRDSGTKEPKGRL